MSERRAFEPYGLERGKNGERGKNLVIYEDGRVQNLGGKTNIEVDKNTRIRIMTPGGGGYG